MIFLSLNDKPGDDYWSMALLKDIIKDLPDTDRELVVVPGEYQDAKAINDYIQKYNKVLFVLAADEENRFDLDLIKHKDIIIYSMYPTDKYKNVDFWLPLGYTPHTRPILRDLGRQPRINTWFFSGQVTHDSRFKLVEQLKTLNGGILNETAGFTQGYPKEKYIEMMSLTKVIPSPGGAVPESFRFYEALEAGAIPVAEDYDHHAKILTDLPPIFFDGWDDIKSHIVNRAQNFTSFSNLTFAWWQMQKRQIRERFKKDLGIKDDITVIIPTSPVISNPDIKYIEEAVKSARYQLPDAEIIITFDGIREEQKDINDKYQEYIARVLWLCNFQWENVTPIVFEEHTHQVGMARKALEYVNTPYIVYVEHDAPFNDKPIDWDGAKRVLASGQLDMIRFHFEATIPKPHDHMMLDKEPIMIEDFPVIRTAQWSQRPHIATKTFYERILKDHFSPQAKSMIEDKMHGVAWNAYDTRGKAGWNDYKLGIYAPEGSFVRNYHTDAREGADKYDKSQVF